MKLKEKLERISKKSPYSIRGLIALDALSHSDPEDYFNDILDKSFAKQKNILRYRSFSFITENKEIYEKELELYLKNNNDQLYESIWEAFSNVVRNLKQEVGN